ncbi:unnamed protein product (macronuclear) [Paramecium tetraurelia]|uniref:Zinc finger PHD-type domain-containing protein n=1 Tax=Paramecium tetraurelia TaxID=5888 RepID=A0EB22_PARTE|nr:uncharacterized protein GSPATT00025223001 [Paramecium tetraurelia]CAK92489.1 unnamed protein product [Paramecium tetraurelia]|eukprot:XP_001459886.1 hypothetical protein (macronuclear) [Paramecium tetraurelia strain d4-2]
MLNSTASNQDEIILKSSRRFVLADQAKDQESAPIYRPKRSSKKVKLTLVTNQPYTQSKICYICRRSCLVKLCKCDDVQYHPDCVIAEMKKPSSSISTLQCLFCLCFFKTEIKNKKFHQRKRYRNFTVLLAISIAVLFIILGVLWNQLSSQLIIILFIINIFLSLIALYTYKKIYYLEVDWKLLTMEDELMDPQAYRNAKIIFQAVDTNTAHYIFDTEIQ